MQEEEISLEVKEPSVPPPPPTQPTQPPPPPAAAAAALDVDDLVHNKKEEEEDEHVQQQEQHEEEASTHINSTTLDDGGSGVSESILDKNSQPQPTPETISEAAIQNESNQIVEKLQKSASSAVVATDDLETKVILTSLKNASNINYVETVNWKKGIKGLKRKKYVWTFLTIAGFVGGVIIYTHDLIIRYMFQGRLTLINSLDSNTYFGLRLFLWVLFNLVFIYGALLMTIFIAPASEASGIPAIKAILNGTSLEDPLSFTTFIVKIISLPAVLGTGMFFGKVGPSAHIGALLTSNMLRIPIFKPIASIKTLKNQMIACGCALGVGSNFSTPGGGVLFALEVIGSYYSLRGYLKSFYVAVVAAFTSRLFNATVNLSLNLALNWSFRLVYPSFSIPDLIALAILGFIMGVLGIIYIYLNEKLYRLRDRFGSHYLFFKPERLKKYKIMMIFENRVIWTLIICTLTSVLTFPDLIGKYMSLTVGATLEDLVSPTPLSPANGWITNSPYDIFYNLAIFIVIRFVFTIFSMSLPLPGGTYIPLVIIGAACGRFFGEIMVILFPKGFVDGQQIYPGAYAVVGIVSLTASVTHAFSTVFIFLEIAGVAVYLPSLLAALIAVRLSRFCTENFYDSIIKVKGWPALLESATDSEDLKVTNIMTSVDKLDILEERMSLREIGKLLKKKKLPKILPVVTEKDNLILLGQVYLKSLEFQYNLMKSRLDHSEKDPSQSNFVPDEGYGSSNDSSTNLAGLPSTFELQEREDDEIRIEYDTCEITLSESQSAQKAHMLFSQLCLDEAFVVWKGRLMGQIARQMLINTVTSRKRSPIVI